MNRLSPGPVAVVQYTDELSGSAKVAASLAVALDLDCGPAWLLAPSPRGRGLDSLLERAGRGRERRLYFPLPAFHPRAGWGRLRYLADALRTAWACWRFFAHFRARPYRLVIVTTLLAFPAALAAYLAGRKLIWYVTEVSLRPRILLAFLRLLARRLPAEIWVLSRFMRKIYGGGPAPVVLLPPAVFPPPGGAARAPGKAGEFRVALLGRPKPYKGVGEFAEVARLCRDEPALRFLLAGPGAPAWLAQQGGSAAQPNLAALDEQEEMDGLYGACDLVVNLSLPEAWTETFGLTLVEALARGIPVLAPRAGGPPDFVRHGENGFLVEPHDPAGIARLLRELVGDPARYRRLAANARDSARAYSFAAFRARVAARLGGW